MAEITLFWVNLHYSPRIPGHEIVGRVAEVGPHEKKWKKGDRIGGAWHGGHDGTCRSCNSGFFQMCENAEINGVSRDGGCEFVPASLSTCLLDFYSTDHVARTTHKFHVQMPSTA